jgi:hypothetical protein
MIAATLDLDHLRKLARESLPAYIARYGAHDLDGCIYVVADASRRPGSDLLAYSLVLRDGLELAKAHDTVKALSAKHAAAGEFFGFTHFYQADNLTLMLSALGSPLTNARGMARWVKNPARAGHLRLILVAGTKLELLTVPTPVVH